MVLKSMTVQSFLNILREIDDHVNTNFEVCTGRKPELADKQQKSIEEIGEVIKAVKENEFRDHVIDEIWDSAIAALSQAFVLDFTNKEIQESLDRTLTKLCCRWKVE